MMTSSQIRQSFLGFFKSKQHSIVPSSTLMPDSPNLLFTNAGMNQFVPIFLGQKKADVSKWAGAVPGLDTRAADTQKCIRAGGKHNDLEDVGLDTYHHTFFEMLGNWSFGDYFKKEAIEWAWELLTEVWKFPPRRLYATVYCPHMARWESDLQLAIEVVEKGLGKIAQRDKPPSGESGIDLTDRVAAQYWVELFRGAGRDPREHILPGNRKDNFWMMGDTGPCGPCSEIHIDLTPAGDMQGKLVNAGSAQCIEIWNLVFIQFNANADGTFSPLPAKHVDTGMGFERVTSIIQGTKNFKDFTHAKISNYETDIFRPIFDAIEKLSGKKYGSTLPNAAQASSLSQTSDKKDGDRQDAGPTHDQTALDIAFRVIADHIRTLGFAIADGIQPGNTDRNYVLRRILRRAVRYGRTLGFKEPFFYKLVDVLADTMGDVFPEIRAKKKHVQEVIRTEEEAFNKTLDMGILLFNEMVSLIKMDRQASHFNGDFAFKLYDTYGFPLDLTELMARERGLTVDKEGFERLMDEQRARARAAQKKQVISLSQIETTRPTKFVGYEKLETPAKVLEVVSLKNKTAVVLDTSACYAEMGGQVGDAGELSHGDELWRVVNTQKSGNAWLHFIETGSATVPVALSRVAHEGTRRQDDNESGRDARAPQSDIVLPIPGNPVTLSVDKPRREAIQRHHTVTHLFHWALHEVVSKDASQKGSFVGPDKLTFDFNSAPLTSQQVADIEKLVNERILENAGVSWTEVPYADVRSRRDVMQFFGDKYGDIVRVVQIGGRAGELNGYSMELCGGTHTHATGEIGLFRIVSESAIAAGVRRIEAIAGLEAYRKATDELELIKSVAGKVNSPVLELDKKIEALLAHQKEMEKQLRSAQQREASNAASRLLEEVQKVNDIPAIIHNLGAADGDFLQSVADSLKDRFKGIIVLGGSSESGRAALVAAVTPDFLSKIQAGKLIQQIAPIVGGKGGGKPDNARGGGKDASKVDEALARVKKLLG